MSQWVDNNNAEWVFDDAEGWGPFNADETGKLISIASTVSIIDTQAYKDLERLISIASTVSATDLQAYKELEMLISIISTISAGDAIFHNETGRLIPIASDVSVTDLQTYKDIVNIPIASTVSVIDLQTYLDLERLISIISTISISDSLVGKVRFTSGSNTFAFSKGRSFPVDDPAQVNVAFDYSCGGQMYAYGKGIQERFFNLILDRGSQADFDNFSNWLTGVGVGPKNTFTYRNETGNNHTVRLMTTKNPLKGVAYGQYSGTILLRKEV